MDFKNWLLFLEVLDLDFRFFCKATCEEVYHKNEVFLQILKNIYPKPQRSRPPIQRRTYLKFPRN